MSQRQLTKSTNNRMISGVIAGICEYFGWGRDVVTILRILFVVLAFGSWGGLIFLYFVASWIMPSGYSNRGNYYNERNRENERYQDKWDRKAQKWEEKADKWSRKMDEKSERWANRFEDKARHYDDRFTQDSWNSTKSNNWGNPWEEQPKNQNRKMKDAEPISDEKEDDWSDF
ncbi:PspC domain-containing protein [Lactococcus protaetiae]|uniref:PspC domain-containing protein n=1 Tax=Lactococcus protaetiae TaxID=2592653 RepID=A0A514Z5L0_9LACT|nr:PspC domain-containing protein [Lactococcus protaetiae]QDK69868.1 PspC domain-containing protein [Lactococcus protaetiae]